MDAEAQSNPGGPAHVAARLVLQANVTLTETKPHRSEVYVKCQTVCREVQYNISYETFTVEYKVEELYI